MKILVTGAAGFIGSHTSERLKNMGYDILGLDNFSDYYNVKIKLNTALELAALDIKIIKIDLRNLLKLEKLELNFDYIFHFAAQPGISKTSKFEDYLTNNIIATNNLLTFAKKNNNNLKLFVNISTSSIYVINAHFNENRLPIPVSNYGVTKLAAEHLSLSNFRNTTFYVTSLRLFSVYRPRELLDKLYPKLIKAAFQDTPFTLFEGIKTHLRSFTFIDDIVDGIVSVIGKEKVVNDEIFNLGNKKEFTTQEGIIIVEKIINKKIKIKIIPKRDGDQQRTHAIIDKAHRLLNYNPSTSLKIGLEKHIDWYKKKNSIN